MRRLLATQAGLLAATWLTGPAFAQTADDANPAEFQGGLEEIIVTAERRADNLQNVPVAVTALTANALEARGIDDTTDLTIVTPGLTYTTVLGSALPRIRGVGAAIALGGNENPVATYVDGVYIASSASSVLSLNNIEQIAVLKGPQGTLFGRNATGGLIQITSLDPDDDLGGKASGTVGNRETFGGNFYITGGLTDGLAADLAVYYRNQGNGFGRNLVSGADVGQSEEFAIRSKWRFDIGPDTVVRLAGDYSEADIAGPVIRAIRGTLPITGVPFTGGDYDVDSDIDPRTEKWQGGGSLNITHDFGMLSLLSITAYRESEFHPFFDIDKLPVHIVRGDNTSPERQFSQEVQLLSPSGSSFRWVVGAFYFQARAGYQPLLIDNLANDVFISSQQRTTSYAAFGQATYDVSDRTSVTLGLRYTDEKKEFSGSRRIVQASGFTINSPVVSGEVDASKLTWRLALDHNFSDDILGYVSYNRGFKSGGFNPQSVTAPLQPFKPEILDSFEIGLKADLLDKTLRFNGAAFYYDYQDIQINAFTSGVSTITNAASASIYGIDFDLTAAPSRNLTLTAGASLLHARFKEFPNAILSTPRIPNGTTILGGNTIGTGDAAGNRLPLTPDWTVNLSADYVAPLPTGSLAFSLSYFHSDGWRAEADNRIGQEPYDLVNGSIAWFIDDDKNLSMKVWGKNLTDKAVAVQINAQPETDGIVIGTGRTFGLTLDYRF